MTNHFSQIPEVVIDYVRRVFAMANDKVTRTMCVHPSMHEETLDHTLVMELSAAPPAYFAQEQLGVVLESHWLGGRWMFERWEIADIALFVLLRRSGNLVARKVALLQTKRLYSKEIPVSPVDEADYRIGIGRLADRTDQIVSLSRQRMFRFDASCAYGATNTGHAQVARIDQYVASRNIPVYYAFYNPLSIPYEALYPTTSGAPSGDTNELGVRVLPSTTVHAALASMGSGATPTLANLQTSQLEASDPVSVYGWRLEKFVADELLRCRQGKLFDGLDDQNLQALLYQRSAPIAAAITITIDIGGG